MVKRKWTDEERSDFGKKMQQARKAKQAEPKVEVQSNQNYEALQKQIDEIMETNTLLKAALLGKEKEASVTGKGVVGVVEKYLVDPANYPDPTKRLAAEPRLLGAINFPYNYELQYTVSVSNYETKSGVNMKEPKFSVQLNRIVLDERGDQTDKRYVARRLIFHEDPQAALVIARDNNIEVDQTDEKTFLDEMRYLRVRDWLYDVFWPGQVQEKDKITEEVIGGTVVQVFTKSSLEESEIPFEQLKSKLV